jgi:pimeloyl-ACP methyl ester carboxylesterase
MVDLRPTPGAPVIANCLAAAREVCGTNPQDVARTVLVGHSVGCQVWLRHLASLPEGTRYPALVCIAGWFAVDEPWDTIRPWIDTPVDYRRVAARVAHVRVLLSDDDPFTADHEGTAALFRDRLGARVELAPSGRHFNRAEEPAVMDTVRDILASVSRAGG